MIAILFFSSGFLALVYELLWVRTLTLTFGTTVQAVSIVLAVFFGGLAAGNALFGRLADRLSAPVRAYGLLESLIGLYGLLYPGILAGLTPYYLSLCGPEMGGAVRAGLRFAFGGVLLLPPTILMGGTLPLVTRHVALRSGRVARPVASLYAVNTAGAVAGALLAGFFLIGTFGVTGTMRMAAALGVATGLAAFLVPPPAAKGAEGGCPRGGRKRRARAGIVPVPRGKPRAILVAAFVSGLASLTCEVIWTRVLVHVTGTTTYAFATILAAFLSGIAAGGVAARRLLRGGIDRCAALSALAAAAAAAVLLSTVALARVGALDRGIGSLLCHAVGGGWRTGLLLSLIQGGAVMFIPAALMGAILPVAVGALERGPGFAGRTVGGVFSLNTLGAILGSAATGFLWIPVLGSGTTIRLVAGLYAGVALLLLGGKAVRGGRARWAAAAVVLGIGTLALETPPEALFGGIYPPEHRLFFAEGTAATVAVVEDEDPMNPRYRRMFVDGNGLSGTDYSGRRYMKLLGHLPALLTATDPESALVICLGTGMTLGAVRLHPSIRRIDCVEISREVVEASEMFSRENGGVLDDPEVRLRIDDGRNYLRATRRRYDLITLEPPPPRSAGVVNLYSREFYRDARARMRADGVLCQWIPLHDQSETDVRALIRTVLDVFPHVTAWLIERNEVALIATVEPQTIDLPRLAARIASPVVAADLRSIDIVDPYDILALYLMDERALRAYAGEGEIITDDHPAIEFFLFRGENRTYRYSPYVREEYLPALERMRTFRGDVRERIRDPGGLDSARLAAHRAATRHFVDGTILRNQGKEEAARREFRLAVGCTPDNGWARHYLGASPAQRAEAHRRTEADPTDGAAWNRLGYIHFVDGEPGAAAVAFQRVLELDPSNVDALVNLGRAREALADGEGARRAYARAVRSGAGARTAGIEARIGLLDLLESAARADTATRLHEAAVALWRAGRFGDAVGWFERAIAADPGFELARYNLASTLEAMGRYREALVAYEESLALGGGAKAANNVEKLRLLDAIERTGRGEVELTDGRRIDVSWGDARALDRLGIRFYRNGEYAEAAERFVRATIRAPDFAGAFLNAGDAFREMGEAVRARVFWARAAAIDPALGDAVSKRWGGVDR